MFSKILIANRGEIACRVIKTCRRLGIKTVAVYSEADADALHVEMADEAVLLGPPAASESYLRIDKILEAIKQTGAEAVHPGYGFLSENPKFAAALQDAGVAFIGPNAHAIEAMGDKIASKKLAAEAGVNTVPGFLGVIQTPEEAVKIADDIGYPVMIKASAGGGGKGMRIAHTRDEVADGFTRAMNEARSSFGDDRVFIEKFVTQPRHIEIQVLGDKHGNVIHLGERECSIQRRNQKVIEEAPSPFLDDETRAKMGAQACALAKAVDYDTAGTVEFIVDGERNFYFLEMNTRLQVEHPVTELVTGVDLVEQMIRVAAGETLALTQDAIKLNGWAIESRVYAEDPYRNFLPSIGRLVRYRPPEEGTQDGLTIRNDTGVFEGGEISMFYDPMIAKLCTHGPTRAEAIAHMEKALGRFLIDGIEHNIPFCASVMRSERFKSGALTTGFIAEEYPDGFEGDAPSERDYRVLGAMGAFIWAKNVERERMISGQLTDDPYAVGGDYVLRLGKGIQPVHLAYVPQGLHIRSTGEGALGPDYEAHVTSDWVPGDFVFTGAVNGEEVTCLVHPGLADWTLRLGAVTVRAVVETPQENKLVELMPEKQPPDLSKYLLCPMPGLVVSIDVEEGQEVKAGQPLAVVEAMKMENVLRAENDGKVSKIVAGPGDSLAVDDVILEFE